MARDKKSFVAYADWNGMFQKLPDEVAGKLIKHVFKYVNDENPETDDYVVEALFEQIKATLKRDLDKWERQREQRVLAGKRSAEKRATKSNERSTTVNERQRNSTVSVSGSVSVSVKDREEKFAEQVRSLPTELPKDEIEQFINHWTEMNPNGRKMKFEKEKTFDLEKRLAKWTSNYYKWNKEKSFSKKEKEPNDINDFEANEQNLLMQLKKSLIQVYGDFQNQSMQKRIVNEIRAELLKIDPGKVKYHYKRVSKYCEQKRGTERQFLKNLKSLIHGS